MSAEPQPLRLGFVPGVTPGKWARRWAEFASTGGGGARLELVPLGASGRAHADTGTGSTDPVGSTVAGGPADAVPVDVILERTDPSARPTGSDGSNPTRRAVRLYEEAVALVVAVDHEIAAQRTVDRETLELVQLLDHPDHQSVWPDAEPWTDERWAPTDAEAALDLVASGSAAILLPLPLARRLAGKRRHAVLTVDADPPLPGTEIWATWDVERDGADVQRLIGIFRGGRLAAAEAEADSVAGAFGAHGRRALRKRSSKNRAAERLSAGGRSKRQLLEPGVTAARHDQCNAGARYFQSRVPSRQRRAPARNSSANVAYLSARVVNSPA